MTVSRFPYLQKVLAQLPQIQSQDFTPELAAQLRPLRIDFGHSGFTRWTADPTSECAPSSVEVAYQDGTPIGWAGIGQTRGHYPHAIIGVFVHPTVRGQGLGERLIQAVLKSYKENFDPELDDATILYDQSRWPKLHNFIAAEGFLPRDIDSSDYPLTSAVLADAPLPDLTDEEFWKRNFVRTQDRPGKRLGVELKHYLEFHRKEHPKGSQVTPQDLCQMLRMTSREASRVGLAIQYLLARKTLQKTKTPDQYRVL